MNEFEQKKQVQNAMNRSLSGLKENPFLARRIMAESKGEKKIVKKKISAGFILSLVLLVTLTALAVGLVFSPKYDAKRLANQALKEQYGIEAEMMSAIHLSEDGEDTEGNLVFTYRGVEDTYADQIGVYTVKVKGQQAHAVWSHDGEDTSGGIEAKVWGAKQIAALCANYSEVMAQLLKEETAAPLPTPTPQGNTASTAGDIALAEAEIQAQHDAWETSRAQVMAASKITLEEAYRLAVAAIRTEYGLSETQSGQLVFEDWEYGVRYRFVENQPIAELSLHLSQVDDKFTVKDGIYVITINMETSVIEDMLYDSGLAGNG